MTFGRTWLQAPECLSGATRTKSSTRRNRQVIRHFRCCQFLPPERWQLNMRNDHRPVRTLNMSYLVYRELLYPLGDCAARTLEARNEYARAHQLPVRTFELNWKDTTAAGN